MIKRFLKGLDQKYLKICMYAAITALVTVIAGALAFSRVVLSSASIRVGGRRFLLLSLDGDVPLGSALLTAEGQLAGIVERGKDFGGIPGEQEAIMALGAK